MLGSLLDKNIRLQLDHPMFKKLQDSIERPCRSIEWFPMAEQAINTVYALAERPDVFCDRLIKNLARRVFEKKPRSAAAPTQQDPEAMDEDAEQPTTPAPAEDTTTQEQDTSDVFLLSQLLFVVGHVAIKQIVFLELVEREWKRQKHEREAGTLCIFSSPRSGKAE